MKYRVYWNEDAPLGGMPPTEDAARTEELAAQGPAPVQDPAVPVASDGAEASVSEASAPVEQQSAPEGSAAAPSDAPQEEQAPRETDAPQAEQASQETDVPQMEQAPRETDAPTEQESAQTPTDTPDIIPTLGDGEVLLSVRNIYKGYKKGEYVLNNFSLDVCRGQIVGLLGPNGCGKTTLLKMVAGLLVPDKGTICVSGEERSELTNRYISYLPERTYFTPGMKVTALLDYFEDFYDDFNRTLAEEMLLDLSIPMDARLRTLSKGMKEKVQLVLVMSRKTKLYLLDEPIGGVDPAAREYVLNTILSRYNTEASVIITTHLIADVEPILDSFAFLGYGGEILAYGASEDAREETGKSLDELFREVFRCYRRL